MTPEKIEQLPYRPCVGVMLINAEGLIFAGQRIDSDVPAWQMPQGGVDKGEEPSDAAVRELWEETGVTADQVEILGQTEDWLTYDLPHDIVPKIWKGRYRGQKQLWFCFKFNGVDGDIRIDGDPPEFSKWRWISAREMVDSIVPFKRDIYENVTKAFAQFL
ncbi:RNA pyrophosphohydrolase [Cochlodiniinecator piscidefendens]|uniref:RNA pyrophosphohydrolase n=1 Tax=Cochlodiniinecator piscidefendens TaxID=2715756 RepID=UPI00140DA02D|nr:RNA pyrophosphohydrolase [Cochlodiniinecator piscidefendens]